MFSITYNQSRAIVLLAACVMPVNQQTLDSCNIGAKTLSSLERGGLIKHHWEGNYNSSVKLYRVTPWGEIVAKHIKAIMEAGVTFFGGGAATSYGQKYFQPEEEDA